jgi:hypothetical protein
VVGGPPEGAEKEDDTEPNDVDDTGPRRSICRGASLRSRLGMVALMSTFPWGQMGPCIHVSATYGDSFPSTRKEIDAERDRLNKFLGQLGFGLYRIEYQVKRFLKYGKWVIHWHVLLWIGDRDLDAVEDSIRSWWEGKDRRSSSRYANPHYRGIRITRGTEGRAAWYLAMHEAKNEQSPPFAIGRWWGYIRRPDVVYWRQISYEGENSVRYWVWAARLYRRCTGYSIRQAAGLGEISEHNPAAIGPQGFRWFLPRANYYSANHWINLQLGLEADSTV